MKTICRECIFAKWTEHDGHKTQTGCLFDNRIDKFENVKTLEEDDKTFFEIPRLCNACRKGEYKSGAKDIVRKQIQPSIDFIVLLKKSNSIKDIKDIVGDIIYQKILPKKVFFVATENFDNYRKIYDAIKVLGDIGINHLVTIPTEKNLSDNECIRLVVNKCKSDYYSVFNCDFIPDYFTERIDKFINEDMLEFLAIKPKDGSINGTTLFRRINKSIGEDLEQTIQFIEDNRPDMVLKWT